MISMQTASFAPITAASITTAPIAADRQGQLAMDARSQATALYRCLAQLAEEAESLGLAASNAIVLASMSLACELQVGQTRA